MSPGDLALAAVTGASACRRVDDRWPCGYPDDGDEGSAAHVAHHVAVAVSGDRLRLTTQAFRYGQHQSAYSMLLQALTESGVPVEAQQTRVLQILGLGEVPAGELDVVRALTMFGPVTSEDLAT